MKNRFLLLALLGSVAAGAQLPQTPFGTVLRFENFASEFVPARNVDVWLPEGYDSTKKYAVLYMHDGQMLFDSTTTWNGQEWGVDETVSRLIAEKQIRDCIVVGIWNGGVLRHSEYFPQKPFESLTNAELETVRQTLPANRQEQGQTFAPTSDNYLKFLVTELKPFIDSHFSTHRDRQNTFVAGSSMGGLISMYAICEYPRVFGGAACLSTHWPGVFTMENNPIPGAFLRYLEAHLPDPESHKIYFDYGTATLDSLYEGTQVRVDSIMRQKGFSPLQWKTQKFPGADHSERAWRERLEVPLTFLAPNIFYPKYEGNPIVWQGERYYGNIKKVESSWSTLLDDGAEKTGNDSQITYFNQDWQVSEHIYLDHLNVPFIINRPLYGYGSHGLPVVENIVKPDGELNSAIINQYRHGILEKSTEFTGFGSISHVIDLEYNGDTIVARKQYFNSGLERLDDTHIEKTTTVYQGDTIHRMTVTQNDELIMDIKLLNIKFDKYGNWVERKCHTRILWTNGYEESDVVFRQKIEYYTER
ncbi:MAG: esterase family protein [Lewinellaceae bacterium]|nr:esterase family protein [Lewinellaceae bacterium]